MFDMISDWTSVISSFFSAVAAIAATWIAFRAFRAQQAQEKNQLNILKNEILLKNFQQLIVSFSNILSASEEAWSDDRKQKLQKLEEEIFNTKIIIATLNNQLGEQIDCWYSTKNNTHESVMTVTKQSLSYLNSNLDQEKKDFLMGKSKELSHIYREFLDKLNS